MATTTHKTDSEVLREIAVDVATIKGRLDGDDGFINRTTKRLNNHTLRIRALEIVIATATGALVLLKLLLGH